MLSLLVLAAVLAPGLCRDSYIVGGSDVKNPGEYPWQASLQQYNSHICGMALISEEWLATAAHCVGSPASVLSVVVGMHDRVQQSRGAPSRFKVDKIIKHPDWEQSSRKGFPNDMAVVRINGKADLSSPFVAAVPMAERGADFVGSECVITGWGKTSGGIFGKAADILQVAPVDVYTKTYCQSKMIGVPISDFHICVGDQNVAGACSGDSGGPMTCKNAGGEYVLAGVTSFGQASCTTSVPSVYTRISYYRDWIQAQTGF